LHVSFKHVLMRNLKAGEFFGTTNETVELTGLTLTDTEYTHQKVDWHWHEKPYFTFIIQGKVIEINQKETYHCTPGTLLFHNWQDAHYNIKPPGFTRGFHVELNNEWFNSFEIKTNGFQGSLSLSDPRMKTLFYQIWKEAKTGGPATQLAVDALLLELFGLLSGLKPTLSKAKPVWVGRVKEILHTDDQQWKLQDLAKELNIHPVHLSRDFSKHFNCKLGGYIRLVSLQRALALLPNRDISLTRIATQCKFADQSHFIRAFKTQFKVTPSQYRNLFSR